MDSVALRELSKEFYRYLSTERDVSPNTRRAYEGDIRHFLAFLEKNHYGEVDLRAIRAYMGEIYGSLKKSSLSRKISSIKVFFKFLKKKGHIADNPAALVRNPRMEKRLPKFYTVDEMFHFLDTLPEETWINLRNRAIFELDLFNRDAGLPRRWPSTLRTSTWKGSWPWSLVRVEKSASFPFGEKARDAD